VIERTPWNLLQFSEQFDNAAYTKVGGSVVANNGEDPNGLINADTFTADGANSTHRLFQTLSATSGTAYTASFFVKKGTTDFVQIAISGTPFGSTNFANFNILTGVVGTTGGDQVNSTISDYGNGWYRISSTITAIATASGQVDLCIVQASNSVRLQSWTSSASVIVYGAQVVEGTDAKPYFATTNRQDVPRLDYRNADGTLNSCPRLLLEPQRTNSIRNSTMVGAVAGSPGTLPTNYTASSGTLGLTRTIVGTGTESGLTYLDVRFNGTASSTGNTRIAFESTTGIAALVGQSWSLTTYAKIVSSPNAPNSLALFITERNSAGSGLIEGTSTIVPTSSLQRFTFTRTNTAATCAFVEPLISFALTNGAAYDFTIRIAAPQMELGATASTFIPTTTAAVTRLADAASKTGVSDLIGQTEGTLFFEFTGPTQSNVYYSLSPGGLSNVILVGLNSSGLLNASIFAPFPTAAINVGNFSYVPGQNYKVAFAYNSTQCVLAVNGSLQTTGGFAGFPAGTLSRIAIDNSSGSGAIIGTHNQAALFTRRLTNAELAQLTT
jgi:hypothetical protein